MLSNTLDMQKLKKIQLLTAIFLFCYQALLAQKPENEVPSEYIKISGQYRIRPEYRNGYRTLAFDTTSGESFIGQRARLIVDYKKNKIAFYTSLQDSRTWGDEEQRKDIGRLQFNEAWLELALPQGFSIKMGRQELAYDDHRILGNLDWANLTISHDALLVKYTNKKKDFNWHIGGAYNQVGEPLFGAKYNLKNYKHLGFTWMKKDLTKIHSTLGAMAVMNGMTPTDTFQKAANTSYTIGPVFNFSNKGWKAIAGAYYQTGKTDNNLSISAYMVNGYVEYRKSKLFGGLGTDLLSGNSDNTLTTESNNFSTLYATNHKFYGYMDYFLTFPGDTKQRGLIDMYVRFGIAPKKEFTFTLDVHSFSLANPNNIAAKKIAKGLGQELDLMFDYKPTPIISLQVGYCMMFATKNMELIKGGDVTNYNGWAYVMLKVSPTLFIHEFTN